MEEKYDFFTMGINAVKDEIEVLRRKADEIEEIYGEDARLEFEAGFASIIPSYMIFVDREKELSSLVPKSR